MLLKKKKKALKYEFLKLCGAYAHGKLRQGFFPWPYNLEKTTTKLTKKTKLKDEKTKQNRTKNAQNKQTNKNFEGKNKIFKSETLGPTHSLSLHKNASAVNIL